MTKKHTSAVTSPARLAKTSASAAPLSETQLAQVNGGLSLNFSKIEYNRGR